MEQISESFNGSRINFRSKEYFARRVFKDDVECLVITIMENGCETDYVLNSQLNTLGINVAYEDPRWFQNENQELYCSIIVVHFMGNKHNTSVGFFHFNEDRSIQHIVLPDYKTNKQPFIEHNYSNQESFELEKNWQFFFHEGSLYSFYKLYPEQVLLKIDKISGQILSKKKMHYKNEIDFGFVSGGANPIIHKGQYYSFFHTFTFGSSINRIYHIGLAIFEAQYPFIIKEISFKPILSAGQKEKSQNGHHVIFPGSARKVKNGWEICCGKNDKAIVDVFLKDNDIIKSLNSISPPSFITFFLVTSKQTWFSITNFLNVRYLKIKN